MGHPEVPVIMNRQFVLDGRHAENLPALKHVNDNPPVEGEVPLRQWLLEHVAEELQKNPKADEIMLHPAGSETRFKVTFE